VKSQSKRAFVKELNKVVEMADVILEVLDARDPMGCRNPELEARVMGEQKKLILVMNKIDLIPPENARVWLKYLRQEFPTVLIKCNT
jgi:nuclear GTP-binding protein